MANRSYELCQRILPCPRSLKSAIVRCGLLRSNGPSAHYLRSREVVGDYENCDDPSLPTLHEQHCQLMRRIKHGDGLVGDQDLWL